jgi:hypothetical protein
LGENLSRQGEKAYNQKNQSSAAELYKEAEATLTALAESNKSNPQIETALFVLKKLTAGKAAPEIDGEDVDGKKFKLSDYRGKVVMLDFWGHW